MVLSRRGVILTAEVTHEVTHGLSRTSPYYLPYFWSGSRRGVVLERSTSNTCEGPLRALRRDRVPQFWITLKKNPIKIQTKAHHPTTARKIEK
jgi:hypothetical protein